MGRDAMSRRTITDAGADRAAGRSVVNVTKVATPLFDLRFPRGGAVPGGGGLPRDDLRARGVRHSPYARATGRATGRLGSDRVRDGRATRARGSRRPRRAKAIAADRSWPAGRHGGHAPAP